MGFFAGLNTEKYDRQYTDNQLVGRIIAYFKPQSRRFIWVSILVALIADNCCSVAGDRQPDCQLAPK